MAFDTDPYRTLGLARGASLAEVKRAYRRLAKANHPDAAGEAALPRFLAIRLAYDQIAGPEAGTRGGRGSARAGGSSRSGPPDAAAGSGPRGPWWADPDRTDATHRAYSGRARRARARPAAKPGTAGATDGPAQSPGTSARDPADRRDQHAEPRRSAGEPGRSPNRATLGSTSYDGAEGQPFEPDWGGASWYGTSSGTYWTLNPKEYADPRKHGPEYQARARRATVRRSATAGIAAPEMTDPNHQPTDPGDSAVDGDPLGSRVGPQTGPANRPQTGPETGQDVAPIRPADDDPPGPDVGSTAAAGSNARHRPEPPMDPIAPSGDAPVASHSTASWWRATAGPTAKPEPPGRPASAGPGMPDRGRPERPPATIRKARPDPGTGDTDSRGWTPDRASAGARAWLEDGRPVLIDRIARAVAGWAPIALGIGWLAGEITGCGRFSASCDSSEAPIAWLAQVVVLAGLLLVPRLATVAAIATVATLAAAVPGALLLSATGGSADLSSGRDILAGILVVAWAAGLAAGLWRALGHPAGGGRPVS